MTSKNRLTVNLADNEHLALEALATRSKVSKAWIARHAICELLERAGRLSVLDTAVGVTIDLRIDSTRGPPRAVRSV